MPRRILHLLVGLLTIVALLVPAGAAVAATGLDVRAFVNGEPAEGTGPDVAVGSSVIVTFEITNPGTRDLYALYLWADAVGAVACPDRRLRPGATTVCEATVVAGAGEVSFGATATAWPDGPGSESASVSVSYRGVEPTDPGFVNVALGRPARHASSRQWSIGTDAALAVDGNRDGDIDGGSVAITYRVSEAWWEVDLGTVTDIDHVVLWNRTDCCDDRLQHVHVFVSDDEFPARDIEGISSDPGVLDVFLDEVLGRKTTVPIGRGGRFVRIQLEYRDAVLGLAEVEVMAPVDPVLPPPPVEPKIALILFANSERNVAPGPTLIPGDPITYTYRVRNTGDVSVWSPYVWHDGEGAATCPSGSIEPGSYTDCSLSSTVRTGATATRATAQAWDGAGREATAGRTMRVIGGAVDLTLGLAVEVLVNGDPAGDAPGPVVGAGDVVYEYRVANTGQTDLWAVSIWHDGVGEITCGDRTLPVGAALECERSAPPRPGASAADVAVSAWDAAGRRAGDSTAVYTTMPTSGPSRALSLRATVAGDDADTAPGPVVPLGTAAEYSFYVTNEGSAPLYGLWVGAGPVGTVTCADRTLDPGETVRCSATQVADAGTFSTTTRAVAYDGGGVEVDAKDPISWFVPELNGPAVRLEYLIDGLNGETPWGPRLRENDVSTFTFIVSNTGSETLTGVAVSDDRHGSVACPSATIAPGASMVCSVDEVMRLSRVETWATVTASGSTSQIEDRERLYYHVKPYGRQDRLLLEVSINGNDADHAPGPTFEVGRTVTVRYVLTNNAFQATMWSADIIDPQVPRDQMQCSGGPTLGHNASMVCTATVRIGEGGWSNLVFGVAYSNNGSRLDASDRLHYTGIL